MSRRLQTIFLPAATGALVIAAWYAVHALLSEDLRFLLPTPTAVVTAFRTHADSLARAALNTTQGALLGFALAVIVSSFFALALSLSRLVRIGLYPYLMILQMTPVIVFAPILVIWVGAGLKSVTIITFLICFFPLVVNTTQGLVSTDRHLVELFAMWRTSRLQQVLYLRVPAALPYFSPACASPPPSHPSAPSSVTTPPAVPPATAAVSASKRSSTPAKPNTPRSSRPPRPRVSSVSFSPPASFHSAGSFSTSGTTPTKPPTNNLP